MYSFISNAKFIKFYNPDLNDKQIYRYIIRNISTIKINTSKEYYTADDEPNR